MATWPTCGQHSYITPAVLEIPKAERGDKNQKGPPSPHVGKVATSPLPSWGSATLSTATRIRNGDVAHMCTKWLYHPCRLGGDQPPERAQESEMPPWPICGPRSYITPALLVVPHTQCGDKHHNWLCCQHIRKVAASTMPCWGSPMLSAGAKGINGDVAHMWAKWLHHPCRLGGPQRSARGQKSEMATWATYGLSAYITPALLGSSTLNAGTTFRNGYVAHMWAQRQHEPGRLGGPERLARAAKTEIATWPTCGQSVYITATNLGVANAQSGDKN